MACTATPADSSSAPTSRGVRRVAGRRFAAGTATRSANTPSMCMPMMPVRSQVWALPVRQA